MHLMNWIVPTASFLEILLLLYVAVMDIATRLIRNEICLVLALLGIAVQFVSPMHVTESLAIATILLLLLIVIYEREWMVAAALPRQAHAARGVQRRDGGSH